MHLRSAWNRMGGEIPVGDRFQPERVLQARSRNGQDGGKDSTGRDGPSAARHDHLARRDVVLRRRGPCLPAEAIGRLGHRRPSVQAPEGRAHARPGDPYRLFRRIRERGYVAIPYSMASPTQPSLKANRRVMCRAISPVRRSSRA